MGDTFEVRFGDLDKLEQLFTRQNGHMARIQGYVTDHCAASGAFDGPVLGLLQSHYDGAFNAGKQGFGNGAVIADACTTEISGTKSDLVENERRQVEAYNKKAKELGLPLQHFSTPPRESLGPPEKESEASHQGAGAAATVYDIWNTVNGTATQAADLGTRAATTLGDPGGVTKGEEPTRWGDHIDPKHYWENLKNRGVDNIVNGTGGTRAPDGPSRMPGSMWDEDTGRSVHHTASGVRGTLSAPGAVITGVHNVIDAGANLDEAGDLAHDVDEAANGPANTGSVDWAHDAKNGGGW